MKYFKNKIEIALILFVSMMILFPSCSDDNFLVEDEFIEDSEPDTIPYIFATGLVLDTEGRFLSNAEINYHVDGVTFSTTTDAEGRYEIRDIKEETTRATIQCNSDGFLSKTEILINDKEEVIERNFVLARDGEFDGAPSNDQNSYSITDSLVSVSGRLINSDGEGIGGIAILAIDFSFTFYDYGITDENGYWSIATTPLQSAFIASYTNCFGAEVIVDNIELLNDTDTGEIESSQITPTLVSYSGFITDCNTNEGLLSGSVTFSFPDEVNVYTADVVNGSYFVEFPRCTDAECVDIRILAYAAQSGIDTLDCQTFQDGSNVLDYTVCNEAPPTDNGGLLTTNINGILTEYTVVGAQEENGNYLISALDTDEDRGVIFITETTDLSGSFTAAGIIEISTQNSLYSVGLNFINYQIDSITTEFMYGQYEGSILDGNDGQLVPIDGTFRARINQ